MSDKVGFIWLVGAGCGKADLITVRGLERLSRCDAVVYDDLIDTELLSAAPRDAQKLYMGKRSGLHSATQAEISSALISLAREGKRVVRLKGGDPYVFGRGGEEFLALKEAGIPCEEVPGISSAIAIPAMAGIPVTHRGLSRSLHIITAHTADTPDGLLRDADKLARIDGTLVFLMGLSQLPDIACRLMDGGMPENTPSAVISGGNSPHPSTVRGALADIARLAAEAGVRPPAVIVIGAVAALELHAPLMPLDGVSIGLTGTPAHTSRIGRELSELGASVFVADRAEVRELPVCIGVDRLRDGDWVVFTSGNGVRIFFDKLRRERIDIRTFSRYRFAVIGAATGEVLAERGIFADLCPKKYTSEALAESLLETVPDGASINIFRSQSGSEQLFGKLSKRFQVFDVPIYELCPDETISAQAMQQLSKADYLCFSSSGGVASFHRSHGDIPANVRCVCIGEVTAYAFVKTFARPFIAASEISAHGVVQAILTDRLSVR